MTIKSMTGFARIDGGHAGGSDVVGGGARWHWEVRSVNGRGLDLRFRLPPGFDQLEPKLREAAQKRLVRGSVTMSLNLQQDGEGTRIRLNEAALAQVVEAAARVREITGGEPPRVDALLTIKGVLEVVEPEQVAGEALTNALLASAEQALDALVAARGAEGARLSAILDEQLAAIEQHVAVAAASPARSVEAVTRRLAEQVHRLTEAAPTLDAARLHQEAVLMANRIDIEEEVKRLTAHVAAARELQAANEAVGRKLDFLAQEFNREANTLCSKANDADITRAGLQLKSIIDQLREQVQNIE